MSRHVLGAEQRFVVGWDQPLQTYFAQHLGVGEDAPPCWWIGLQPRELYDLDDLKEQLPVAFRALLTPELEGLLYADRDEGR